MPSRAGMVRFERRLRRRNLFGGRLRKGGGAPSELLGDRARGARATHVRLEIGHQATLEVDDDLVVLDVPVAHGGQAPEAPALMGDGAPAAVDEAPATP
jgi:hypothetical protein